MSRRLPRLAAVAGLGFALMAGGSALAQESSDTAGGTGASGENVTESYGYTNFGELKYGPDFDHLDYVNPDAPKGGEIAVWSQGTFDSFNQFSRKGVSAALNTIMYESLMTATADDPYGLYCLMCETVEYPESLDWVTFHLRDDVRFANGDPLTAEDVKFSHELFMEQGIAEYRNRVGRFFDGVEVVDDHTVRFTFTDEAPRRDVMSLAGGTTVFSKDWFEETGARIDESSLEPFMGTGAYQLASYDINRQIVYERNPDYWGADLPINLGRNNFDSIRVEYFADSAAALEGFKSGAYTFRIENSSKDWATGYDFPAVEKDWVEVAELEDGSIAGAQAFIFNLRDEKWQDPRVREAVRLMFNFEWSNETLFYGLYERVNSFWENSELEATGTPSDAEKELLQPLVDEGLLDASILTEEAVMAPISGDDTLDRGNLRKASQLLNEAGWEPGQNGFRSKDGEPLTLTVLQYSPAFDRIVNPFVENLRRLGVDAKLERVDSAQYVTRTRNGDYDLVNHTFSMGFEPGSDLEQWYGSNTAEDSSRNLMGLKNEAVDRLIGVVAEAETLEELEASVHALDRVLRSIGFWVPQWFKDVYTVAYYDMYRHPDPLPPYSLGYLDFWWYDQDAAETLEQAGAFQ